MTTLAFQPRDFKGKSPNDGNDVEKEGGAGRAKKNTAPSLRVSVQPLTADGGAPARELTVEGREAWALDALIRAGSAGCTPLHNPAPRWSDCIFKLRHRGVSIETLHERHDGPYSGRHGRYVLRSRVRVIKTAGLGPNPQARQVLA